MITTTKYYSEFLRYSKMAETQQRECNLGTIPHAKGAVKDPLMRNVKLYDVVERKYAGFTQVLLDVVYGDSSKHPYYKNMNSTRAPIAKNFRGWYKERSLAEILFVFIVHRISGSGINYAKFPSGYHNTVVPEFYKAKSIRGMQSIIENFGKPKFTSVGYQFPAFPKPSGKWKLGGDMFLCTTADDLACKLAKFLERGGKKDLRQVGDFMFDWNTKNGLRHYKFQYAAVISDIADFFPDLVNTHSPFYYGSNAVECMNYMASSTKLRGPKLLDAIMERAVEDTGYSAYNVEDQMCDCIRWIENYIRPGGDYDHLDRDKVWSSHKIHDHPYGRQLNMLKLNLVQSFNDWRSPKRSDFVLTLHGLSVEQYKAMLNKDEVPF